jgi:hypothetical protein
MVSTVDPSHPWHAARPQRSPRYQLAVTTYDRAASLLIALLILVGITVACLLVVYFTTQFFARPKAVPVTFAEVGGRPADAALGLGRELEPPGAEDVSELLEPQVQESLSVLSDAVSQRVALLDDRALDAQPLSGHGQGVGDNRQIGPGGDGNVERVPRAERWEMRFEASNLDAYARQLDSFQIELAVVGAGSELQYAYHLAQPTPDRRTGSPDAEKRMYMTWRRGPLMQADRDLLARAGIPVTSGITLQFYPAGVEAGLAAQEKAYAGQRDVSEIRKTVFGVRQVGNKYEFYVIEQMYF